MTQPDRRNVADAESEFAHGAVPEKHIDRGQAAAPKPEQAMTHVLPTGTE